VAIIHLAIRYQMDRATYPESYRISKPISKLESANQKTASGAALVDASYWSCTARSLPGRNVTMRAGALLHLSPVGPHRFTHHPRLDLKLRSRSGD